MICDDSAVMRSILLRVLASDASIKVVSRASNGKEALEQVCAKPDLAEVLILDIEMPQMDGLTALPLLLKASPGLRVIIASSLTTRGAKTTLDALRLGAADYVAKPSAATFSQDLDFQRELLEKVRGLGKRHITRPITPYDPVATRTSVILRPLILCIGSSTGGPQALTALLQSFKQHLGPAGLPIPAVLTQHMPPSFTPLLADQLGRLGGISCAEAIDGEVLRPGHLHIAPGGKHLLVLRSSNALVAKLDSSAPENFCRPSVDPMLRSATLACSGKVLMLMLTGMGQDGLASARELTTAGGSVFAQDEASSVVWGMPGAVARAGLCHAVLPIPAMAKRVVELLQAKS